MNKRNLLMIFSAVLALAVILVEFAFILHLKRRSNAALLRCQATNAGVPLQSADARVYVHPAGNRRDVIAEGDLDRAIEAPPGQYDVRVVLDSRDRQAVWIEGIELSTGNSVTEEVRFEAGEVVVDARVGTQTVAPEQVVAYVFPADDHNRVITAAKSGETIALGTGTYDVRVVWTVQSQEKDVVWLEKVIVQPGQTTRHDVAFERGTLLVRARNAGTEQPSGTFEFTVYQAGDDQREVVDEGVAGEPLELQAGRYDVEVSFAYSSDKLTKWLRGVEIRENETSEKLVDFSSGVLLVHAELPDGRRLESYLVYLYYYRSGDHQEPLAYAPAGEAAVLESGTYDVRAHFFRSHDRPDIWLRNVVIYAGETVERSVTFQSGWLMVRVYHDDGTEIIGDNTLVTVHAVGERSLPVTKARSGEQIALTAREYDVRVEDTRRPGREVWGSRVPHGKAIRNVGDLGKMRKTRTSCTIERHWLRIRRPNSIGRANPCSFNDWS